MAGATDKEKGCDMSNHDCILAAFREEANYICVHRLVDPNDAKVPLSRQRLFYMGFHAEVFQKDAKEKDNGLEDFALAFKALWDKTVEGSAQQLKTLRLDDFLYGEAGDPSLEDVPSVRPAFAHMATPPLPIADDCGEDGQLKKKRRHEEKWPKLHLAILEASGAPWTDHIAASCGTGRTVN